MDTQLRKGVLDVCVLMAIKNEASYGYKIIKDLSGVIQISESTLYTILKRLEEGKLLTVWSTEFDGRIRKYYRITEKGLERIENFKNELKELMQVYNFISGDDR